MVKNKLKPIVWNHLEKCKESVWKYKGMWETSIPLVSGQIWMIPMLPIIMNILNCMVVIKQVWDKGSYIKV